MLNFFHLFYAVHACKREICLNLLKIETQPSCRSLQKNTMSILNHFGKVKTPLVPYTSKYPGGTKIYHLDSGDGELTVEYCTVNDINAERVVVKIDEKTLEELSTQLYSPYELPVVKRARQYILEDFADIIKKITSNFSFSVWKTLNTSPLLTKSELLWLKVDDVNSHVEHLEKILIHVIEENKLLRIDALETKCLATGRLEKRLMQVTEENNLLQHRLDALQTKCLAIGQLEKRLMQVTEENNLLQHRLDALQTKCLAIGQLEKRLVEENNLLQNRLDALETKCLIGSEKRLIQVLEENNLLQRKMEQVLKDHVDKILIPEKLRERDVLYELD